jgi:hypothetical protein
MADSAHMQTAWIDDHGTVVATRPEVVIAAGGALWSWREGKGNVEGSDCECTRPHYNEPMNQCATTGRVVVVDMVDLVSGRKAPLLRVPVPFPDPDLASAPPEQGMTPVGSVGPYLFTEQWIWSMTCGANHGASQMRRSVVDLRREARGTDLVTGDTLRVLAPQAARARAALMAEERVDTLTGFQLTALEPAWAASGRLEMRYRFAVDSCWACGDGRSSGYSRSTLVAGPVPAPLAPWSSAPAPVRRYWAARPPRSHAGWSEVAPGAAQGALEHFRAR